MRIVRFKLSTDSTEDGRMGARLENGDCLDASSWNPPNSAHQLYDLDGEFIRCLSAAVEQAERGEGDLPTIGQEPRHASPGRTALLGDPLGFFWP